MVGAMEYLPICVRVRERACLVVGGGEIALRKATLLSRAGARLRVVAPHVEPGFEAFEGVDIRTRGYAPEDLDDAWLAVAATDDKELNRRVSADAQARGVPVNVVDAPALCTFVMPAIVDRAPILVAISTAGASPVLARSLRGQIEALLPPGLGPLSALLGKERAALKARFPDVDERRVFTEQLVRGPVAEAATSGDMTRAEALLMAALAEPFERPKGQLTVVGVGPGDPDLLTLRAQRVMQEADRALYDAGIPVDVVDRCRRDAMREPVSGVTGPDLEARILACVAAGERLVYLAPGDGRAAHGMLGALQVAVVWIPGVTVPS